MKKSENRNRPGRVESISIGPQWVVWGYLALMLGVFPLYYQDKYYDMGDVKYLFFRAVTLGMLGMMLFVMLSVWLTDPEPKKFPGRPKFSAMDLVVLAYGGMATLSFILSPFRSYIWIGSIDWYMGLLSQLLFVAIYFAVSRYGTDRGWPLWFLGFGGGGAFLFSYLHRFRIDPLGLYEGLGEGYTINFLGTIGQATWYSSWLCTALPIVMGVYVFAFRGQDMRTKVTRALTGALLFIGFCSAVTQNSDSAYIGLGMAFLFLLWFAVEEREAWKRYVELGLIAVSAAKFTGLLQTAYPDRVPGLEPLSFLVTKGKGGWLALALGIVVYAATCLIQKRQSGPLSEQIMRCIRLARAAFYSLLVLILLAVPVLMWLIASGRLQAGSGIVPESGYLVWSAAWGNGRGQTWSYCARVFLEYSPLMKLLGCGPDALTFYSDMNHAAEIQAMWGGASLTNAHNEWFNALINYGLIGAAAYLSIFVFTVFRIVKNRAFRPVLLAAGASILSYAGHNFFCYQQAVCTPLVFIVIGTVEYIVRRNSAVEEQ